MSRERKQREFQAGLAEEVDAWLRGDTSKRTFLKRLVEAGGVAALARPGLALLGTGFGASAARAAVELADPSTPFGQAQAAAVKASTEGPPENSAYRAVQAAKQYQGATLNMTYESGLQALEPRNFSGPLWQDLTGIGFNVEELPHPDQYSKPIAEHIATSGAYDVLDIEPAWIPSLADGGVILPIDDYVAKYMDKADLEDYHPLYQFLPTYKGKRWGFFDDGDVLALYYRTDVFGDPKLQQAYKAKYKKDLAVPKTWDEYAETAQFITDQLAPNIYGAAHFRKAGSPGNQFSFLQEYRANGGKFFDDQNEGAPGLDAGLTTFKQMIAANKASVPGNNDMDAVAAWVAWLQGKAAMLFSWPPTGRMSENYAQRDKAINFVPQSTVVGKVGYAVMPGGNPEQASGYVKSLAADFEQRGGRLPVHAVGDQPGGLARARDGAVRAARSLSHVALHLAPVPVAVAERQGLSDQPQQLGEWCRARHDHARLAGLRALDRPHVHRGLGRRGAQDRARAGGRGVECDHPEARRRQPAPGLRAVREAARLLRRPHDRDDGPRGPHHLTRPRQQPRPPTGAPGRDQRSQAPVHGDHVTCSDRTSPCARRLASSRGADRLGVLAARRGHGALGVADGLGSPRSASPMALGRCRMAQHHRRRRPDRRSRLAQRRATARPPARRRPPPPTPSALAAAPRRRSASPGQDQDHERRSRARAAK